MKKSEILKIVFALIISAFSYANVSAQTNEDWTLLTTKNNVSVYAIRSTCDGQNVVVLKIVNNNASMVRVSWSLWEGQPPKTAEVNPKDITTGGCESTARFELNDLVPQGKTFASMKPEITIL